MFEGFEKSFRSYIRVEFLGTYAKLNVLAAMIGTAAALAAIAFRGLILGLQNVFLVGGTPLDNHLGLWLLFVPAIGAVFVGAIWYWFAPEVKGAGVADVMKSIVANGGRFRARTPFLKAITSSITIGSGGSAGREGPIVQIGASLAGVAGQRLKLTSSEMRTIVACGAAGGIAATFNTPLAGAMFALELLLLEFKARSFVPLIISTVFATLISRLFLGDFPAFSVKLVYSLISPYELAFYLLLGLLAGTVGVVFIKGLSRIEDVFDSLAMPPYARPALGALLVGAVAIFYPSIMGVGYDTVTMALNGNLGELFSNHSVLFFAIALLALKLITTSLTLGSGGSGGVIGPSLFMGAMLGAAFGMTVHDFFPSITAEYGAYAMVGMAAVFAATGRATLTAILMLYEMTYNYNIILPLMFACVVSDAMSNLLSKETIFTERLAKQGIKYVHDLSANILEYSKVKDVMVQTYAPLTEDTPVRQILDLELYAGRRCFPVVSKENKLKGIITSSDVRKAFEKGKNEALAKDIMSKRVVTVYPEDTLQLAFEKMVLRKIGYLPVVDPAKPNRLLGVVDRESILDRYRSVLVEEVEQESLQGRIME
jgi:CIC family chloride channel protein